MKTDLYGQRLAELTLSVPPSSPEGSPDVIDVEEAERIRTAIQDAGTDFARLANDQRKLSRPVLSERIAQPNTLKSAFSLPLVGREGRR